MSSSEFSMVQECVYVYQVRQREDGKFEIYILVPERFSSLWMVKLSELRATAADLKEFSNGD